VRACGRGGVLTWRWLGAARRQQRGAAVVVCVWAGGGGHARRMYDVHVVHVQPKRRNTSVPDSARPAACAL
jgi:hypothetical protein